MTVKESVESTGGQMVFQYSEIFFSCYYNNEGDCFHQAANHSLNYVYSGEMVLDDGRKTLHVRKGEAVFIRRDHRITIHKKPYNGEQYSGIFMMFTRNFLRRAYSQYWKDKISDDTRPLRSIMLKLSNNPELDSLFSSMVPYFSPGVVPSPDLMDLKLQEGLISLLHIDRRFAPTLFDFNEPWKIDIIEFMSQNYMYEFTLEELANYTGRSLATFKRDFSKISDMTPQKWLIHKRLEVAYEKIKEGNRKVQDVYTEVGFKNQSHFSTAFKKKFGYPPTALTAR